MPVLVDQLSRDIMLADRSGGDKGFEILDLQIE